MKHHRLTPREKTQVIAALRLWGRWAETGLVHPKDHPMVKDRFREHLPMTLDEIETLIGRLEDSWRGRGLRTWNPWMHL
jgi:hypothetical protein